MSRFKNWRRLLLFLVFFISGCSVFSPQLLGISDNEWEGFDENKKLSLQDDYRQIESEIKVKLNNVPQDVKARAPLLVSITKGKVIMPPFVEWFSYQPIEFTIAPETCMENTVYQEEGPQKIQLRACYQNGVLFLDSSRFDRKKILGSIRFYYSPLWEQGFIYRNVNTSGYVRLREVDVKIQQVDEIP